MLCWPFQVSDMTGKMSLTKVSESSPFRQDQLITDDCFILDNGQCGKIYVWKGDALCPCWGKPPRNLAPPALLWNGAACPALPHSSNPAFSFPRAGLKANEQEQRAALKVAEDFISQMKYPPNTQVRKWRLPTFPLPIQGAGGDPQPEDFSPGSRGNTDFSPNWSPRLTCFLPGFRWRSCPRAVRAFSSNSSSATGNETGTDAGCSLSCCVQCLQASALISAASLTLY